ncbi:MAG TPA: hypothetical protein VFJ82_17810 [Longimicrobium sp.]|nr:hypothetical protein [Longimicrobium sp.]
MKRSIERVVHPAAGALAAALLLSACSDAPTAPGSPGSAAPPAAALLASGPGGPVLVPNAVKYRDAGGRPATGRAGSATLTVRALLAADGVTQVDATAGAVEPRSAAGATLGRVQVKAWDGDALLFTRTHAGGGAGFRAEYPGLPHRAWVQAQALVRGVDGARTDVVTAATPVLLRPDLSVSLVAPPRVEAGTDASVLATVAETNGDVGARADCVLYLDGVEVDRADGIWVDAGDAVACRFWPRLGSPGTHRLEVRVENVDPGDFDPSDNRAEASVQVLRSEMMVYSASAEDRTYTSRMVRRRIYTVQPLTFELNRTDEQSGRVQASVLYGSFAARLAQPFSAEVEQRTGGTVLHAAGYTSTDRDWLHEWDTANGITFSLTTGSQDGGRTTVQYDRHTGSVTYWSTETLYGGGSAPPQREVVYTWSSNRVEVTGSTPPFGADFAFRVTVRDSTGVWRAWPAFALAPFTQHDGHDWCTMNPGPSGGWEIWCEIFTSNATGVRGSGASPP